MLRLTLRNLAASRVRFLLTGLAVVLAVSFVVSSFVLADGLRRTFSDLSTEIVAGTDLEVRPVNEFGDPRPLPVETVDTIAAVAGVDAAAGLIEAEENAVRPLRADGSEIPSSGPPQLAFGWIDDPRLSSFTLVEGQAPRTDGEFAMDIDSAERHGFDLGRRYEVLTSTGRYDLTLVGLSSFGANNDTVGAVLMQVAASSADGLFGTKGVDSVLVALEDGASASEVQADLEAVLSAADTAPVEIVGQATLVEEQTREFNDQVDLIGNILLGFAAIALFVSIFIIANTFSIVLSSRTRELGLLRTVGADPGQLQRAVLGEALAIGIVSAGLGIVGGLGLASGLRALFAAIGADLPDAPTIIAARTVVIALLVGVGVTVVAAFGPARRAGRVPPIVALSGTDKASDHGRARWVLGTFLAAVGTAVGAWGVVVASGTSATVAALAGSVVAIFIGVTLVSPAVAQPVTRILGWPLGKLFGPSGRLARDNAGRNPSRTATTAAALMIGLALVSMALTVGESVKAQLRSTLDTTVQADVIVTDSFADAGFGPDLGAELAAVAGVDAVVPFRYDEFRIDGAVVDVVGTDQADVGRVIDLDLSAGSLTGVPDSAVDHPVLVSADEAASRDLRVGDPLEVTSATGATVRATVAAVFDEEVVVSEPYVFDLATWERLGGSGTDLWLGAVFADGVSAAEGIEAVARVAQRYPQAEIETASDFRERSEALVDSALTVLNALVALAVVIALIGIANTLALSVLERTREIGLLRAVGMTRRQVRRMVRLEAALVALFGAALGVVLGVAFGWAAVAALPASITSTLAVPYGRILVLVIVAAVAGLGAALLPARRAARMDVLDAISA